MVAPGAITLRGRTGCRSMSARKFGAMPPDQDCHHDERSCHDEIGRTPGTEVRFGGDTWLSEQVPAIMGSPAFTAGKSLLVLTWDEGSFSDQVVTIFAGASVRPAAQSAASYDHYSLLRTIEHAWGLAPLTSNDGSTTPMTDLF